MTIHSFTDKGPVWILSHRSVQLFVNLRYDSGKEFGTQYSTGEYRASLIATKDELGKDSIQIEFEFSGEVEGRSQSKSRPETLTLKLTESEALKLASAIFAHSHHPSLRGKKIEWMDPKYMHQLNLADWANLFYCHPIGMVLNFSNRTKVHLGVTTMDVVYRHKCRTKALGSDGVTVRVRKEIDLRANDKCRIELTNLDLRIEDKTFDAEIIKVDILEVTGLTPR